MDGPALPIRRSRRELVEAVRERPFLIVTGETGSGKSTQLPKYLYEAGNEPPPPPRAADVGQAPINSSCSLHVPWRVTQLRAGLW